jgi:hypothetical protein
MGTRLLYQIQSANGDILATLYSNCSHSGQNAESAFQSSLRRAIGPTGLLQMLLACRYLVAEGNHRRGDRLFWLVPACEKELGDFERLLIARNVRSLDAEGCTSDSLLPAWTVFDYSAVPA